MGKKSEKWPKSEQDRRRRVERQVWRGGRGRRVKMNREGRPHIACVGGGRTLAVGHWLFLSRVARALFTLGPFSY